MVRNVLGALLALAGATAAVWSPFRPWYDGRHGSGIRVDDLFTHVGVTPRDAALLGSLFLPMFFAALLTLLGVLVLSRFVVAPAGVLVLGLTVLWMVRQAQYSGSLTAGGDGLGTGVGFAFVGGLLILLAAFLLPGHRHPRFPPTDRRYGEPAPPPYEPPYDTEPHGTEPHGTKAYDAKPFEAEPYVSVPHELPSYGTETAPLPVSEPPDALPPWDPPAR